MRNALSRLAPCAVFACSLASAQQAVPEKVSTSGGTGTAMPATGMNPNSSAGMPGGTSSNPSLAPTGLTAAPAPVPTGTAQTPSATPGAAALALPMRTVGSRPANPGAVPVKTAPNAVRNAIPNAVPNAPSKPGSPGAKEAPSASSVLDTAARGVSSGEKAAAEGGDGQAVRQALDRAYDSAGRTGDVDGAGLNGVAGKFSTARERVANLVGVANNAAPADAPGLYGSAVKIAEATLPPAAAAAVAKAVLTFAARKAEVSLSALAQAAYTAAAAGQGSEARRLVKSIDKWEELLGAPGRPLIANGAQLKTGVERTLAGAADERRSAPRVWVVKRGESYVAALPGTTVEKVPGLAASFAMKLETFAAAPMAGAYRAFAASPGAQSAFGARVATGESVPSGALGTGWHWLRYLVMRAWSALTSLLPGRRLPATVNASTLPRLRAAALSWRDAAGAGDDAARVAGEPRLTVSRARGAFALALRSAAAHESLSGERHAVARIESLASEFEAGVKRSGLSSSDGLTPGLEMIVSGDGGLRHWVSLYASDARERGAAAFGRLRGENALVVLGDGAGALAAPALEAAAKELSFTVFGDALWASGSGSYGAARLSAELRSTEDGGSLAVETELGDEALARSLDERGFAVVRRGRGLVARLDAQTASADAQELSDLAAEAAALITGRAPKTDSEPAGLDRLLADMKRSPKAAAAAAASLDGSSRLSRARLVGVVGEYEAVTAVSRSRGVRVIALRDPATGLSKFARIEPLRAR